MNRKILGVVASIVLAALGTFAVLQYVRSADDRAAEGEERVAVLVVSDTVAAGEAAASLGGKVEQALVPARLRAAASVASLDELAGTVAAVDLIPGEQLLATRFKTEEQIEEEVGFQVPDNLLQVTVSLSPERAVGGQLEPGDMVAVVASFEPFKLGAVEPGETDQFFGSEVLLPTGEEEQGGSPSQDSLQTPNSSHIVLHKVLVTSVQIERLPTETDRESAQEEGVALAPTGNLLVTLALLAPDVEKVVFSAEHGSVWLADEPETASQVGTVIQTRGTVYR